MYDDIRRLPVSGPRFACSRICVCARDMLHLKHFQVGFKSHAHRVTSDKMARTPEQVAKFLHALEKGTKKKALEEVGKGCFVGVFCLPLRNTSCNKVTGVAASARWGVLGLPQGCDGA